MVIVFGFMVCVIKKVNIARRAIFISLPELGIRVSLGVTLSVICPRVYKQKYSCDS
jgi:hypothetical protein